MPHRRSLLVTALALGLPAAARADEPVGRVVRREGGASLVRGGGTLALEPGQELLLGDAVRTAPDGKVQVECYGGLAIIVGPASEVRVNDCVRGSGGFTLQAMLSVLSGIVRLIGAPEGGPRRIDVLTRAALASVRSTDWLVEETAKGTGVFVREGRVEVSGLVEGQVFLEPGFGTDVAPGAAPTRPKQWGAARRDAALARTTL